MCFFVSSRRFSFRQFDEVFSQARRTAATTHMGFRLNGRGREVAVGRATGRLGRDARDPPRRARRGRLESPSDARSIGQGRDARFFLGSPSRRHVEGDDARHTHLALLQLRHHIGRDQVDGDAEVGSHPSPRRRHRHQACPTRSDGGWRRGRLSCSLLLSRSRQSESPDGLTRSPLFSKTQL